jgi:hypothetical protein
VAILDKLIDHVSKLSVTSSASSAAPSSSSTPPPAAPQSSYLPNTTVDVAWRPIVPLGHTVYSWVGEDDAPVSSSAASSSSTASVAPTAPSASAAPSIVSAPPAASAAPPAEAKARPAAKEKKPAPPPKAGKGSDTKAEEKKDVQQQPDVSRLDIRVGQVVKAWKHPEGQTAWETDRQTDRQTVLPPLPPSLLLHRV